ncbi:uncharacterized protein KY384_008398 [Bacidia gigantensis]|uniref:uncharacterized protein n=1 Tax=Bacidia gigantensis TaxID=2732470 RepID=UPI001D0408B3|nr:uncharacterized protein KY384_008398 [Bacidia gigantensis]KAG8526969.1 hypothetical protein KY384_008398 [Bacidia gigantensis]
MADKDDADPVKQAKTSPNTTPSQTPAAAVVHKSSAPNTQAAAHSSKSPSPATPRLNGVPAKPSTAESQPMTTTSSSSPQPLPQQNGNTAETNGTAPYGTRSRNRTGNSRPNYAEDRDPDMDFEYHSKKKTQTTAPPSLQAAFDTDKSSGSNTRRSSGAAAPAQASAAKAALSNAVKDNLPGMSSFSVNPDMSNSPPAPPISRKRKAPGAAPLGHAVSSNTSPASTTTRRAASGTPVLGRTTNLMTFESCRRYVKNGKLKSDDGTILSVNGKSTIKPCVCLHKLDTVRTDSDLDQVYLICEPPGEPYYLARIMEFLHVDNDRNLPVDSLRVNWYFRPKDVQRKVNDTRVVFASMQSDTCPITSLRGKCHVMHKSEIEDIDLYRKIKDSFYYEKMFDRYIHRYYEVVPTHSVINVPAKVKKVLDERWKYVVVEIGRGKDLTSAIKSCRRCNGYCASSDSVDCAVCKNTYHMNCVRPPLLKKPARGFGWSCGPCSRKQERRLEARNTTNGEGEDEEIVEEEEEDRGAANGENDDLSNRPQAPTAEQLAQAKLWPYRYLGIHCRVEDALDYDDRIYPRASSRLGPKHQANVQGWHGHHVEYVKPLDNRKKAIKGGGAKKDTKSTKEAATSTLLSGELDKYNKDKRPKWILDEPPGYVQRGEDTLLPNSGNTAQLKSRMPTIETPSSGGIDSFDTSLTLEERERIVDDYMAQAKALAMPIFNLRDFSTNFLDKALELLTANKYNSDKALGALKAQKRRHDLKEPELTEDEIRRFEDGVARYGSELRMVSRHVGKSQKHGEIVRFYYMWKKTARGKRIWDNFEGRKGKKAAKQADARLQDDVADDEDDSAFDTSKAVQRKRGFECKFCGARKSHDWRRAPATAAGTTVPIDPSIKNNKDKSNHLILALCHRCGQLWRKYGIQWENIDEVAKKVSQGGGRAWKRRIDEELLMELLSANQDSSIGLSTTAAAAAASVGFDMPSGLPAGQDVPKKRLKTTAMDTANTSGQQSETNDEVVKRKPPERPPEPPLIPEQPQLRIYPCEVCNSIITDERTFVSCRHCRLTVHLDCYGLTKERTDKWMCDTCENDTRPEYSTIYECLLCPRHENEDKAVMEPPKQTHKKKSEREKEKDRLERELITQATTLYIKQQEDKGRPVEPRQALKPTSQRNWAHVICSIMHPSIMFGDAASLRLAEGFGTALQPAQKAKEVRCKLCKDTKGSFLYCDHCEAPVHASCALQYDYNIGVSLTPKSKSSTFNLVTIGETVGTAEAKVSCKEHGERKHIHKLYASASVDGEEMNALKAFAITQKSMSHGPLTGTARKADQVQAATKNAVSAHVVGGSNTRSRMAATENATSSTRGSRVSPSAITVQSEEIEDGDRVVHLGNVKAADDDIVKACVKCNVDVSPLWHKSQSASQAPDTPSVLVPPTVVNGDLNETKGVEFEPQDTAQGDNDRWLCHKCYIRKLKHPPAPPREPTPPPPPPSPPALAPSPPTPSKEDVPEPPPFSPPVESTSEPPALPIPAPHIPEPHNRWSRVLEPPPPNYAPPDRLPNGVPHSSPAPTPLAPPPYVLQAPLPPPPGHHYQPNMSPYMHDRQPQAFRPTPPPRPHGGFPHHQPHHEPLSFQFKRDPVTKQLIQVPYIPPSLKNQQASHPPPPPNVVRSPPTSQHGRSPSIHTRSPSVQEIGPHGPPEADSNPFAAIGNGRSSHGSPPPPLPNPQYQSNSVYGSPRTQQTRPETPKNGHGGDTRWQNDVPIQNGASASPSVKNLLH